MEGKVSMHGGNHKRHHSSSAGLAQLDQETSNIAAPVLAPVLGEPMSTYFRRLGETLDRTLYGKVEKLEEDGVYLHKRPIRGGEAHALLLQGGTALHHVLIYVKNGDELGCLELGPEGSRDVTGNIVEAVPCGPILTPKASPPEANGLPLLHIKARCYPLDHTSVREAITWAQARPYHAVVGNCIHFADFMVRVLTGGAVRGAPLVYDLLCGHVPPQDNPLLMMLQLTMGMTWFQLVDGARMMADFLQQHAVPPPLDQPARTAAAPAHHEHPPTQPHSPKRQETTEAVAAAAEPAPSAAEKAEPREAPRSAGGLGLGGGLKPKPKGVKAKVAAAARSQQSSETVVVTSSSTQSIGSLAGDPK